MYEIGQFAVIGEHERAIADRLCIRLMPITHMQGFPWWDRSTQDVMLRMPDLIAPGMRVLDFGCGSSAILAVAAHQLGAEVDAVEVHDELRQIAQLHLDTNDVPTTVTAEIVGDRYDVVLANVGDALLVGVVSRYGDHGVGTAADSEVIIW